MMPITTHRLLLTMFVVIAAMVPPISALGSSSRRLDETTVPATPNTEIKCSPCCQTPCTQSPPPPKLSPPPPSPPPPSLSPPPSPKKPPSQICPPPPPSPFTYITGPPGSLYPVDPSFSDAHRNLITGLPVLIGCGLFGFLVFW